MNINVGSTDRMLRIVAGVVLLLLALFTGVATGLFKTLLIVVGIVLVVTGFLRICPAYSIIGVNTAGKTD